MFEHWQGNIGRGLRTIPGNCDYQQFYIDWIHPAMAPIYAQKPRDITKRHRLRKSHSGRPMHTTTKRNQPWTMNINATPLWTLAEPDNDVIGLTTMPLTKQLRPRLAHNGTPLSTSAEWHWPMFVHMVKPLGVSFMRHQLTLMHVNQATLIILV